MHKIKDIVEFQNGYAFKSKDFVSNGHTKVVKIKELKDGLVKFFDDTATVDLNIEGYEKYTIKKDDILVALTGDPVNKPNPKSWVGRAAIYRYDEAALLNQRVCKVIPKESLVDRYFLYYYLIQYENFYNLASKATGSASQANISTKTIGEMEIDLPDLETQRKIGQILSNIDRKIEVNNKLNANLEQFLVNLFNEKFGGFEKNGKISDICERVYSGGTPSTKKEEFWNGELNWLSSGETRDRFIITTEKYITQEGADNSSTKLAHKYDIVIASAGQGLTRGQTSLLLLDTYINQSVIAITGQLSYQIYIFVSLLQRYNEMRVLSDGTSTRGSLTTKIISAMEIYIPTKTECNEFLEVALQIINEIELLCKQQTRLAELRDCLLPQLMSVDLKITELS